MGWRREVESREEKRGKEQGRKRKKERKKHGDKNLTVPSVGIFLFDLLLYPFVVQGSVIAGEK